MCLSAAGGYQPGGSSPGARAPDSVDAGGMAQPRHTECGRAKAVGTVQPFETEYCRKDGSRVPVLIGYAAIDEQRAHGVGSYSI